VNLPGMPGIRNGASIGVLISRSSAPTSTTGSSITQPASTSKARRTPIWAAGAARHSAL